MCPFAGFYSAENIFSIKKRYEIFSHTVKKQFCTAPRAYIYGPCHGKVIEISVPCPATLCSLISAL